MSTCAYFLLWKNKIVDRFSIIEVCFEIPHGVHWVLCSNLCSNFDDESFAFCVKSLFFGYSRRNKQLIMCFMNILNTLRLTVMHLVREKVQVVHLKILHVSSQHQIATLLTKPLHLNHLAYLLNKMRIHNIHSPS